MTNEKDVLGAQSATAGDAAGNVPQGQLSRAVPMIEPEFDGDYPSERTLAAIRQWPMEHADAGLDFLAKAWCWPDFGVSHELRPYEAECAHAEPGERFLRLATGGWSGNEDLIAAVRSNFAFAGMWRLSGCGGLHVYRYWDWDKKDENGNYVLSEASGAAQSEARKETSES